MSTEMTTAAATIGGEVTLCREGPIVRRERWEEVRRLWVAERVPIAEIARLLDLDRKRSDAACAIRPGSCITARPGQRRC
jgi:hypothetical protein